MSYQVGIDLGTTYTAAAVHRDGVATISSIGDRGATIPSVVLLKADGTFLTGLAAERRATTEPERVVREFKRRFGDSTPIIVAGSPWSAEALSARLLESVVGKLTEREGASPDRIVVTYPANWGNYKKELLDQMVRLAGLDQDQVGYISEPEAAALSYAAQERVEAGEVVAVYDLGGGTFDAAVLRRTERGFSILGRPEGIERLGGIDFDAAIFAHVAGLLGDALTDLDPDDASAQTAVARLRRDCVEAKEALSSDSDASVPVLLPSKQTEVRITRHEFEALIRPSLIDSLEAMKRAIRSADLELEEVSRVLLVGGSSRIPVVSQLVSSELGRPLAVDAHPKHAVAVGAAWAAAGLLDQLHAPAPSSSPPAQQPPPAQPPPAQAPPAQQPPPVQPPPVQQPPPAQQPPPVQPPPAVPVAAPLAGRQPPGRAEPHSDRANQTQLARGDLPEPAPRPSPGPPGKAKPVSMADLARPGLQAPSASGGSSSSPPRPGPRPSAEAAPASPRPSSAPPARDPGRAGAAQPPPGAGSGAAQPRSGSDRSRGNVVGGGRPPVDDAGPTAIFRPGDEGGATAIYPGSQGTGGYPSGQSYQLSGPVPPTRPERSPVVRWILAVVVLAVVIAVAAYLLLGSG